jgi:Ser/Thr protein kinase RdoA (MazF antagonist)
MSAATAFAMRSSVRALLSGIQALEVIGRAVPALRDGAYEILAATPHRIEVRSDGRIAIACSTPIRCARTGREGRHAALIETVPDRDGSPAEDRQGFVGVDPESGARVWLSPADPRLRNLARIVRAADGRAEVIAHRFRRRAVLHVRRNGAESYVKVYARGADGEAVHRLNVVARASTPFRIPDVVRHDAERGVVEFGALGGMPAHDLLAGQDFPARAFGQALRAAQECSVEGLTDHGPQAELRVIEKAADRAAALDEPLAAAVRRFSRDTVERLAAGDSGRRVLTHRDLHDKQVLCNGTGLGLLDWDLACSAPPALDPANFVAHLGLRAAQGLITPRQHAAFRREFLAGFRRGGSPSPDEFGLWETLARLRLAAVYALRPGWPGLGHTLLQSTRGRKEAAE